MAKISELIIQTILEKENLLVRWLFRVQYRRGIISYYTKIHREPSLMFKNLQGSSHRLKAVGFRLLQPEGFIFMKIMHNFSSYHIDSRAYFV